MTDPYIGPSLPPATADLESIGPQLPPKHNTNAANTPACISSATSIQGCAHDRSPNSEHNDEMPDLYGPVLPPDLKLTNLRDRKVIGAALPPGFLSKNPDAVYAEEDQNIGNNDNLMIGPSLPLHADQETISIADQIEKRAKNMKSKLCGMETETKPDERESWMTELPPEMTKNFGLGPRKFRQNAPQNTGDRSVWTETPQDKLKRSMKGETEPVSLKRPKEEMMDKMMSERDQVIKNEIEQFNVSERNESLLDMHRSAKKKKQKDEHEEEQEQKRRPFSREDDLKTNQFDDAQRKLIVKKSQQLNTKFGHGNTKYL